MKYIKTTFFLLIVFLVLFLSALNFIHFKMREEYSDYYKLSNEMRQLNDTYSLCSGLLTSNPSKENISSCNLVFEEIKKIINKIEDKCPYTVFYTKYLHK